MERCFAVLLQRAVTALGRPTNADVDCLDSHLKKEGLVDVQGHGAPVAVGTVPKGKTPMFIGA